jgi:hypothetical protein
MREKYYNKVYEFYADFSTMHFIVDEFVGSKYRTVKT